MTIPDDIGSALRWAIDNSGIAIWLVVIVFGAIFGNRAKRRRQVAARRVAMPGPPPVTVASSAASAPAVTAPAPSSSYAPVPQAAAYPAPPLPRPVTVPDPAPVVRRSGLLGAFGDPAHARTAVILSELLAPPVALR